MPPRPNSEDERLLSAYREAAMQMQRALSSYRSPRDRLRVLRTIDSLIAQLDDLSATYLSERLPLHFRDGSDEAIRQLRSMQGLPGIDTTFGTLHREALQQLVKDATLKFANALEGVRRESSAVISRAEKQQVISKLLSEELQGSAAPSKAVKQLFEEQGIIAIQGRRSWTLEEYSSMLTHTILADAHNTGAATRYASNGVEFARRIERADCCKICRPLRDKIVSIKDRRLLPPSHPWCYGAISPVIGQPQQDPIMSVDDPRIPQYTRDYLLKKP